MFPRDVENAGMVKYIDLEKCTVALFTSPGSSRFECRKLTLDSKARHITQKMKRPLFTVKTR